ncbi:MAG: sigma-70 family RNA polymerase sigma factor [Polyangiales bacterium]
MAALPDHLDETAPRAAEAAAVDLATVLSVYGSSLRRVAATYARSADQRADLSQEIALALCRALPRFRGESSLRTFALRVAHNAALAAATRQRAHDLRVDPARGVGEIPTEAQDPERSLDAARRRRRFFEALHALPIAHRQVLTLALEGLSHDEIGEVLGATPNAVGVRLHRARQALRERLGGDP